MIGERVVVPGPHLDGWATPAPPEASSDAAPVREGWGVRRVLGSVVVLGALLVGLIAYVAWRASPVQDLRSTMGSVVAGQGLRQTGETRTDRPPGEPKGSSCQVGPCPTVTRTYVTSRPADALAVALAEELRARGFRTASGSCPCEHPHAGPEDVRHGERSIAFWDMNVRGRVEIGTRLDGQRGVVIVMTDVAGS